MSAANAQHISSINAMQFCMFCNFYCFSSFHLATTSTLVQFYMRKATTIDKTSKKNLHVSKKCRKTFESFLNVFLALLFYDESHLGCGMTMTREKWRRTRREKSSFNMSTDRPMPPTSQVGKKEKKSWRDISRLFLGVWCCCVLHTYNHHSVSGKNLITEIELNINWKCMGRCKHNITHAACIFFHRLSTFFSPSSSSYLVDVIRRNQINIQKNGRRDDDRYRLRLLTFLMIREKWQFGFDFFWIHTIIELIVGKFFGLTHLKWEKIRNWLKISFNEKNFAIIA